MHSTKTNNYAVFPGRIILSVCLALLANSFAYTQNLVPNPSFENAFCPTGYNGMPGQVELYMANWYAANCGSPDPMTNCSVNTGQAVNTSVPDVWFGNQTARTGNNYMGFGHYGFTEFLGTRLLQPLVAGEVYNVSFYVSCADQAQYASDALGMYFSTTQVKAPSANCLTGAILSYSPQVVSTPGTFLTDYDGWMEVSGTYVANGGEEYIVIGCFVPFNTSTMNHLYNFGRAANPAYATPAPRLYYYLDDVSVQTAPLPLELVSFNMQRNNTGISLRWDLAKETSACSYEIERGTTPENLQLLEKIPASGKRTYQYTDPAPFSGNSYYRVVSVACNNTKSFSRILSTNEESTLVAIFPNPVTDVLTISLSNRELKPYQVTLYNAQSLTVYHQSHEEAEIIIPFEQYPKGIYLLTVQTPEGIVSKRIVK